MYMFRGKTTTNKEIKNDVNDNKISLFHSNVLYFRMG